MQLIVAIASIDGLVLLLVALASVDDIGITPEVLVEGISPVLVISEDELVTCVDCVFFAVDCIPVCADGVSSCVSIEVSCSLCFVSSIDLIIASAAVDVDVSSDFSSSPDLVVSLVTEEEFLCVSTFTVFVSEIYTIKSADDFAVFFNISLPDTEDVLLLIENDLIDRVVSFTSVNCCSHRIFL